MSYLLLIIGFILLIKGADIFVDSASKIAKKLGIPSIIVGLTIVSIGTSAPELAVSIISAIKGSSSIAMGNVLGSNLFNSLMVLGGTAIIVPLLIKKEIIKRDYYVNLVATILVFILVFFVGKNNILSRVEGLFLITFTVIYILNLIKSVKGKEKEENKENKEINIVKNSIFSIIGVAGIVVGGDIVVDNATVIATSLGMSEKLVGLTIVAMGTSLPELVTSIVAAVKGEKDIALGNVLGSNIFNLLLILGGSAIISPFKVDSILINDFIILIIISFIIGILIFTTKKKVKTLGRYEGLLLLGLYIAYLTYIIIRN